MRKLAQDVFDGAPDWVKSAFLIHNGHAFYSSLPADKTKPFGLFRNLVSADDARLFKAQMINQGYYDHKGNYIAAERFNNSDWQNSAIDRV